MARSVIIDAVTEMCRNRSITHIIMAPETYHWYANSLTVQHRRAGIKYATCHGCGIILVDGMKSGMLITFNSRRAIAAKNVLHQVRLERYEDTLDLLDSLLERNPKWMQVCILKEETDEAP